MTTTDQPLYIFFHLPKTGGTTFTGHLTLHLPPEEILILGPGAAKERTERGIAPPEEWPAERLAPIRVITGHGVDADSRLLLPDRPARRLTFIRDPAPLVISRFNFDASRSDEDIDFETWLSAWRPNPTFRRLGRLLGNRGIEAITADLRGFWFVGATEHLDEDLPHVFETIGVPTEWVNRRVAGAGNDTADLTLPGAGAPVAIRRHATLTPDLAERLRAINRLDVEIHHLALELRSAWRERFDTRGGNAA